MRLLILMLGLFFVFDAVGTEDLRRWTDVKGNRIEAAFLKVDGPSILLRLKDGKVVPTKLENLCAEDRAYVNGLTYVPREVVVTFKRSGYGKVSEEPATSSVATIRDTVAIRVAEELDGKKGEATADSRWKVESVDALGNRILPKQNGIVEELSTDGKFVFVIYTVENESNLPMTVPSPVLVDKRGRKFLQASKTSARYYLPEKTLFAETDSVQPGFKKLFCAFYEVPREAEPAKIEVFPSKTSRYAIERFEVQGKPIVLDVSEAAGAEVKAADNAPAAVSDKKSSVFMKCVRVGQGGDTSNYWYYDGNKKRTLTYGVELRGLGGQPKTLKVKAFFIGSVGNNRDAVVDTKDETVVMEPGKISRISLQSNEVEEYTVYYYSGSRVSGAKLRGVIVQAWLDDEIVSSFASLSQWKRFAESADVCKQMGELTTRDRTVQ